jgi:rhodanese-related sulfurtransferase
MINPTSSMRDVLAAFPGARRALFRRYHIGGCSSCGFDMNETLANLCARNGGLKVEEVIEHIQASHEQDKQIEITATEVAQRRTDGETIRLLDIRTREEWDAVKIEGAEFVNQDLVQSIMGKSPREALLVFYDHDGGSSLDAAAYFAGHGFTNAKYLRGGIDAWSQEVDSNLPRYRLENNN